MKLPPRSRKLASIEWASEGLEPHPRSSPNVIVPRQNGLTRKPELPRVIYESRDIVRSFRGRLELAESDHYWLSGIILHLLYGGLFHLASGRFLHFLRMVWKFAGAGKDQCRLRTRMQGGHVGHALTPSSIGNDCFQQRRSPLL